MVTGDSPSATLDLVRTEGFEEVLHVENETGNRGGGRGLASVVAKRGAVAALVCAAVIALVSSGAWDGLWELFSERDIIRRFVEDAGLLAPAAYVLLLLLQAVFAPLPAPAVAVAGGYVFGITEGFFLTWAGALLGGAACFGLSRTLGRRFVSQSGRMEKIDAYAKKHGAFAVFVLRLVPLISFDAVSYVAGLSGIPFRKFLLATALGMAPGTFVFVYLGGASPGPVAYGALIALAVLGTAAYACFGRGPRPPKEGRPSFLAGILEAAPPKPPVKPNPKAVHGTAPVSWRR